MSGFDREFLDDLRVDLPVLSAEQVGKVFEGNLLRDTVYADYYNYTLAMSRSTSSALWVAYNVNYSKSQRTQRRNNWRVDSRFGDNQLDNRYYRRNVWDRGHLYARFLAAWGDSAREAQISADETFYYTNSCLQHMNLNQDEWLALEERILEISSIKSGKVSVFTGPIFDRDVVRYLMVDSEKPAPIPSAFYKVAFYRLSDGTLRTSAFIVEQDSMTTKDRSGRTALEEGLRLFQVTTSEVEERTGLIFDSVLYESNPLFFSKSERASKMNVNTFPERNPVAVNEDLVTKSDTPRLKTKLEFPINIIAVFPNPEGSDFKKEFVSLMNISKETICLKGFRLENSRGDTLIIGEKMIRQGEALRIDLDRRFILSNSGSVVTLLSPENEILDRFSYTKNEAKSGNLLLADLV